ncbi:hypothetical protein RQP46_008604 [Phenoliferia psychrophenolica]
MEVNAMADPRNALIFSAIEEFLKTSTWRAVSAYFMELLFRPGTMDASRLRTHVLCFDFEVDPLQSSDSGRWEQFRLVDAGLLPFAEKAAKHYHNAGQESERQELVHGFLHPEAGVPLPFLRDHDIANLCATAGLKNSKANPELMTMKAPFAKNRTPIPIPRSLEVGWVEFAKRVFAGAPPNEPRDILQMRIAELKEEERRRNAGGRA